jgi:hypothetical protein
MDNMKHIKINLINLDIQGQDDSDTILIFDTLLCTYLNTYNINMKALGLKTIKFCPELCALVKS